MIDKATADNYRVQILCKVHQTLATANNLRKSLSTFLTYSQKTILNSLIVKALLKSLSPSGLAGLMQRTLAPLRRIVDRSVEVLVYRKGSDTIPQSFFVHDALECGHVYTCIGWDIFDLLYAYTTNPEVSAKRHRCHPCASLLAHRKPQQSVGIPAKEGVL